ncbi:MAG: nucleoside deaminase [Caldiserica bacterium]|nr:nucleoside deaminase [Caldisericota bacterium]
MREAQDSYFMKLAIREARKSLPEDVPVGAIIVREGKVISRGHNQKERRKDPTLHAEIVALKGASRKLGSWYLTDCLLYVTLEPCPMCAGALIQARIKEVIFGAFDPKGGALGSVVNLSKDGLFNHWFPFRGGVEGEACGKLISDFFKARRGG